MSFDQLLFADELHTREFKSSFEADRLLEAVLGQAVINIAKQVLNWARNYFVACQIRRVHQ